jgi:serine protease
MARSIAHSITLKCVVSLTSLLLTSGNAHGTQSVQKFDERITTGTRTNQLIVKLRHVDLDAAIAQSAPNEIRIGAANVLQRVIDRVGLGALPDMYSTLHSWRPGARPFASVKREISGGAHVVVLNEPLDNHAVRAIASRLQAQPEIEYAEPDYVMQVSYQPTDPEYRRQWAYYDPIAGANLIHAWDLTTGSPNTVVAVLDTGIRAHADLAPNLLPGYDFVSDVFTANDGDGRDADPSDPGNWVTREESIRCYGTPFGASDSNWHGTHVAGTIGAVSGNGIGGTGTSPIGKLLPVRVLGKCGGYTSDVADGIRWAAGIPVPDAPANPTPAKVLNLSLGARGDCSSTYQQAIDEAVNQGVVVVAAAGNSRTEVGQPANCRGVIAVAATDSNGRLAPFSNFGWRVDISAPGVGIYSTLNDGKTVPGRDSYASYDGTSMAAPHVSGVVALMLAVNPSLTPARIKQKLQSAARPFPGTSSCNSRTCGSGIVNAAPSIWAAKRQ